MNYLNALRIAEGQEKQKEQKTEEQKTEELSYAQQVRAKVRANRLICNTDEIAKQIFDWVLSLMVSDDSKKKALYGNGEVTIWSYTDDLSPKICCEAEAIRDDDISVLSAEQKQTIFDTVVKLFEKEEGFKPDINPKAIKDCRPAVTLKIIVD